MSIAILIGDVEAHNVQIKTERIETFNPHPLVLGREVASRLIWNSAVLRLRQRLQAAAVQAACLCDVTADTRQ